MRFILATLVVGLAAAPAAANPRAGALATRAEVVRDVREGRPTPTPPRMREPGRRPELHRRFTRPLAPAKADRHEVRMPSVWAGLRDVVSDKLPHGGDDRAFSYTLMPMVISGADDSAPGLGLSGSF